MDLLAGLDVAAQATEAFRLGLPLGKRRRDLEAVDPDRFRSDVDQVVDQTID